MSDFSDWDPDVLASILKEEPDLEALPPIPNRLRHLLERCLAKHPNQRMRDVGDVRLELEIAHEERAAAGATVSVQGVSPLLIAGVAVAALAVPPPRDAHLRGQHGHRRLVAAHAHFGQRAARVDDRDQLAGVLRVGPVDVDVGLRVGRAQVVEVAG